MMILGIGRSPKLSIDHPVFGPLLQSDSRSLDQVNSPESKFLNFISALTIYEEAGCLPPSITLEPLTQAPEETKPYLSQVEESFLLMLGGEPILFERWLSRLSGTVLIPPHLLPILLDLGIKEKQIRTQIIEIAGERGRWLAQLNPAWQYLRPCEPILLNDQLITTWQEGTLAERKLALLELRTLNPEKARQYLANEFHLEHAQSRATLLDTLQHRLGLNDEMFLEKCLDDRSQKVTQVASKLLSQLSQSSYIQRNISRLKNCINFEQVCLSINEGEPILLEVSLPKLKLTESEIRDRLGSSQLVKGKRASRLSELISCVPLHFWTQSTFGTLNCTQVIKVLQQSDHFDIMLTGLTHACLSQSDESWAQCLIITYQRKGLAIPSALWSLLPVSSLESQMIRLIRADHREWLNIATAHKNLWSPLLSELIMQAITHCLSNVKRTASKPLLLVIQMSGLYADLTFSHIVDHEWRAYEDRLPASVLKAINRCINRFVLRHEIDHQTHHLNLASTGIN
jgi:hypothetical protein